jgi:hypothetical protein
VYAVRRILCVASVCDDRCYVHFVVFDFPLRVLWWRGKGRVLGFLAFWFSLKYQRCGYA